MSEILNYEILTQQLNTRFALIDSSEPFELELIEVTQPTVTTRQTYFSLFFHGDKKFMLPQGTYRMAHEQLGTVMFFIVPVTAEADGFRYEAVFNLLNEAIQESND